MADDAPELDAYAVLGLEPTASPAEIRAAFRRMVQQAHPDTAPPLEAPAPVQEVVDAYRILIDPANRARHDANRDRRRSAGEDVSVPKGQGGPVARGHPRTPPPCPICRGIGRVSTESACRACAGTGEITVLDLSGGGRILCSRCGGLGLRRQFGACPGCGGSGRVRD